MENKGFDVQEATEQFVNYDYIKQVYIAVNNSSNYQIEFYETLDTSGAENFYETNKEVFENEKESSSAYSSVDLGNHSKFSLTTDGKFKVISRIDNTIIYLNVDEKNKSEVKNILDELGY